MDVAMREWSEGNAWFEEIERVNGDMWCGGKQRAAADKTARLQAVVENEHFQLVYGVGKGASFFLLLFLPCLLATRFALPGRA